jgi:hypothetical protein
MLTNSNFFRVFRRILLIFFTSRNFADFLSVFGLILPIFLNKQ